MTEPAFRAIEGERAEVREPRFKLIPFQSLRPGASPSYLVKGLIPRVGLTVAWGPPKCGKSFWASDLAMHIALGWEYRGRRVQQGAVVYCALEGAEGFKARAEAFRQRFLPEDAKLVPFYLSATPLDLVKDHAGFVASIRLQLDGKHPLAVFLDTLNRSLHGSESNDEDMTAYIRAADAIRDAFNCAVIVVHHCGIEGTRPRGHTALAGAVDAQIAVKRDTADNIVVTVERMKDGPEGDTIVSALEVVEVGLDDDGDAITSCVVVAADPSERAPNAKKLPASAQIALDLLKRAIADEGKVAPANNHIPSGSRTIRSDLWRAYCDRGMLSQSDKPDSRLKAFVRASEKLQERGLIGVWSDHVWLAGQPGQ